MQQINHNKTLDEILELAGEVKLEVTYPDGKGNHETTIAQVNERFSEEAPEWRRHFFNEILNVGFAVTRFGVEYSAI